MNNHVSRDEETASERSCGSIYIDHSVVSKESQESAQNAAHHSKRSVIRLMLLVATVVIIIVVGATIAGSLAKKSSLQQQTQFSSSSSLNSTSGCDDFYGSTHNGHHGEHPHREPHNKSSGCIDYGGWGDRGGLFHNRTGNETADGGRKNCDGNNTNFHNASDSQD